MNSVRDCKLISLPKVEDLNGNLTYVHGGREIPFHIKRVYYVYDVPGGEARGGHAHKDLEQLVIAPSGSFDLLIDDGKSRRTITLNRPYNAVYIPSMIWREIINFSTGGICLVLASMIYKEDDYIRDYELFTKLKLNENTLL